jgi:hypothetical protein
VLIAGESGILLEDLAPLMASLEIVYRRVLTLYLDAGVRDLLESRHSDKASLAGVSRSINSRYMKLLVSKAEEYTTPSSDKTKARPPRVWLKPPFRYDESMYDVLFAMQYEALQKPYAPYRIELARPKVSSPGFLEILGDPATLTQLVTLLGWLIAERRSERRYRDKQLL